MAVRAVIFDWGGTLTPWHSVNQEELWLAVCERHYPATEAAAAAAGGGGGQRRGGGGGGGG
jgi:putative hydrolase of the HAD superfamily